MTENIYASMRYRDTRAAIDWLKRAFGLAERVCYTDDGGAVNHAELTYGSGIVMLGDWRGEDDFHRPGSGWAYVAVDDIQSHHARAVAAGARVTGPPEDHGYGVFYGAWDPEGNLWSFGTYGPSAGDPVG